MQTFPAHFCFIFFLLNAGLLEGGRPDKGLRLTFQPRGCARGNLCRVYRNLTFFLALHNLILEKTVKRYGSFNRDQRRKEQDTDTVKPLYCDGSFWLLMEVKFEPPHV